MGIDKMINLLESVNSIINKIQDYEEILQQDSQNQSITYFNNIMADILYVWEKYKEVDTLINLMLEDDVLIILESISKKYDTNNESEITEEVKILKNKFVTVGEFFENQLIIIGNGRKLHIGGQEKKEGWEIFDALKSEIVDHVGNAKDLSRFEDETFDIIYSSHVLEHFDYKRELLEVLKEWKRVLKTNGKLYISVPDLDVLSHLFTMKEKFDINTRFLIMRMIFGGHITEYDYHYTGLNFEFLDSFLAQVGFTKVYKVNNLGLFNDTSYSSIEGIPISLNVIATK
jgi:Uncharacterized protein conserved in bacteria